MKRKYETHTMQRKQNHSDKNATRKKRKLTPRKVFKGQHCEYIDLSILKTVGCNIGMKLVVQGSKRNGKKIRRQFLNLDDKMVIAFLEQGKKITDCGTSSLKDVTSQVKCKVINDAALIKLNDRQGTPAPASPSLPP